MVTAMGRSLTSGRLTGAQACGAGEVDEVDVENIGEVYVQRGMDAAA